MRFTKCIPTPGGGCPEEGNRPLTAAEIGPKLAQYVSFLRFTHVHLLSLDASCLPHLEMVVHCLREYGVEMVPGTLPDFDYEWDRDWTVRTLDYFSRDPLYRKFHHELILRGRQGGAGKRILPLSHDMVMPDKQSLIARMPGDTWQKFANLRLLYAYMYALPGKKLLFMGGEFGQWNPWNFQSSLDWHLVGEHNLHGQLQHWVADLNQTYRTEPALHQSDATERGFAWIDDSDAEQSVISFLRSSATGAETILAVFNFTPVPRHNYRVGAPASGFWREVLNSDAVEYGGSGQGNLGGIEAAPFGWNGRTHSLTMTLPPLGAVFFKPAT